MEKLTLWEIAKRSNELELRLLESGGELTPVLEEMERDLSVNLAQKAEAYVKVMEKLSFNASFYKTEAKKLQDAAKSLELTEKRIRELLKAGMLKMGKDELRGELVRIKLQTTKTALSIYDETKIPQKFKILIYKPDQDLIRSALERGEEVPGARLDGGVSLRVYVNKEK